VSLAARSTRVHEVPAGSEVSFAACSRCRGVDQRRFSLRHLVF